MGGNLATSEEHKAELRRMADMREKVDANNEAIEAARETKDLAAITHLNAVKLYTGEGLQELLGNIQVEVAVLDYDCDPRTEAGRKELKAIAFKVSRAKVAIDDLGKGLVKDWKTQAKVVDDARKHAREYLEELRDSVKETVDAYEAAEKAKEEAARDRVVKMEEEDDAYTMYDLFERERAVAANEAEITKAEAALVALQKAEQERQAAKESEERFRAEAKEKAEREAKELSRYAEQEAERERVEAVEAAERAEQDRVQALLQAGIDQKNAVREAEERVRLEAEAKHKADLHAKAEEKEERLYLKEKAGPALYNALKALLEIIDNTHGVDGWHQNGDIEAWDHFEEPQIARAAIALADGEQEGGTG